MWVCRAGYQAMYLDLFMQEKRIYLAWRGFNQDLNAFHTIQEAKDLVRNEIKSNNRISVSNRTGQLIAFREWMRINDYVVIPHPRSKAYTLTKIVGDYSYQKESSNDLHHYRQIDILKVGVPRDAFTQELVYSLGAYRTIFKAKHEEEILEVFRSWHE